MNILFIAGPNGAGKTTIAREYLKEEGNAIPFVNGDDIAARLRTDDPAAAALQGARIALKRMDAYVVQRMDFAVETTLSGRAYASRIRRWREMGYGIALIYLRLPSPEEAIARVSQRVAEGGHAIPEPVVRRRMARSWHNFVELYRDLADEWQVYDTTRPTLALVDGSIAPLIVPAPRGGWHVRESAERTAVRTAASSARQVTQPKGNTMTDDPGGTPRGTLPPDEPSVESVLAALARAREVAFVRAEAVQRRQVGQASQLSAHRRRAEPARVGSQGGRED